MKVSEFERESNIKLIIGMGFTREQAINALSVSVKKFRFFFLRVDT